MVGCKLTEVFPVGKGQGILLDAGTGDRNEKDRECCLERGSRPHHAHTCPYFCGRSGSEGCP